MGCRPPSATICCKVLPAFNRDVTGAQRVLEGVFVALCLATLPASAVNQFRKEDLCWKTAVLHSHHVASPSELGLHDQDLNTWHAGTVKYLLVGDSVLPGNAQEPAEAAEVELVQFLEVTSVTCPGLAAIQQGWEDYSAVDSKLRCLGDTRSRQTRVHRGPNTLLALDSRQEISVSRPPDEDRQLPTYVKSSTFFNAAPSILIDGSG